MFSIAVILILLFLKKLSSAVFKQFSISLIRNYEGVVSEECPFPSTKIFCNQFKLIAKLLQSVYFKTNCH